MKKNRITLNEMELKSIVKKMVRESLEAMNDYAQFEAKSEDNDDEDGRLADMNKENDDEADKRSTIEKFFKKPGVNNAPYAYKLYGVNVERDGDSNEMKNARKKFSACVNHEKNEFGYPYSFTSDQLNTLKGMISDNELSEAVNKAIKKILG